MSTNEQAVNQQQEAQQEQTEEHPLYKEMKEFFDRIRKEYLKEGTKCGFIISLVTMTDEDEANNEHHALVELIGSSRALFQAGINLMTHEEAGSILRDAQLRLMIDNFPDDEN